ncbi:MAG: 30S ribosomal protein S8 [Chlamydiae bacterium RIFCSPHIGHO2_12_FULL_49_11]|nr:MAG: 30S ribosomal protein S8 [Chlamydiae bacterium RIFCSPHIGHO2_12_FULL_49_11]
MVNDIIADLLTRVRNALMRKHKFVDALNSKMVRSILNVFKKTGFVYDFKESDNKRLVRVYLKYDTERNPIIRGLRRSSTSGCRIYLNKDEMPIVHKGLGISVVSTSKGVKTGAEARKEGVGGELICTVW